MTSRDPESSFNTPQDFKDYAEEAAVALRIYQRPLRPIMFHAFLVTLPALPFVLPIFALLRPFYVLEDGFREDAEPVFQLSTSWRLKGSTGEFRLWLENFIDLWWSKTWYFYALLLMLPFGLIAWVIAGGFGFIGDIFFLNRWDRWLKEIGGDNREKVQHVRGQRITRLPEAAGAALNWARDRMDRIRTFHQEQIERGREAREAHQLRREWRVIESPVQIVEGVELLPDGQWSLEGQTHPQDEAVQTDEQNGLALSKAQGEGKPLSIRRDGVSVTVRFRKGQWFRLTDTPS